MAGEAITIYGDAISGNCSKVRWTAERMGVPYTWIEISVIKGEARTPEFAKINPVGQVPAIVLADGRILSQSNAIIRYLAEGSDLIPADRFDRALMDQWLFWEQYSHEPALAVRRFWLTFAKTPEEKLDPSLKKKGDRALKIMDEHLAARQFLVAERLTLADIALVAYTRMAGEGGWTLANWPNLVDWIARVEKELGLGAYRNVAT